MSEVIRQRRMQANYLDCGGTNKSPNFSLLGVHLMNHLRLRLRAVSMSATNLQQNQSAVTIGQRHLRLTRSVSRTQSITLSISVRNSLWELMPKQIMLSLTLTSLLKAAVTRPHIMHAKSVLQSRWQVLRMMTAKWAAVAISLQKEILSRVLLTQPQRHLQQKLRRHKIWLLTV